MSKETQSLMLDAASHGENFRVRRLIASINSPGMTTKMINSLSNRDGTPILHLAVKSADFETVKILLAHKADPNRRSKRDGSTALLCLADVKDELNALEIAKSLLDAKAAINQADAFDQTVLYLCAGGAGSLLIKYLLDRGASPSHFCRTFGKTLLFHCVEQVSSHRSLLSNRSPALPHTLPLQGMLAASLSRLIDAGAEFTDTERGKVSRRPSAASSSTRRIRCSPRHGRALATFATGPPVALLPRRVPPPDAPLTQSRRPAADLGGGL